jgi:16S rRNA (guanine966-N2)-methyltransferase
MRIVGGDFRGKPLIAPEGRTGVRPTSDRARESVFNILMHGHFGSLDGVRVADLFAGTGALGLEALSRGAAQATFVERSRTALDSLRANIATFKVQDRCRILTGDATALPFAGAGQGYGLVFIDPPYDADILPAALSGLKAQNWLDGGAVVVCESRFNYDLVLPDGFSLLDERRYGKAKVSFVRHDG